MVFNIPGPTDLLRENSLDNLLSDTSEVVENADDDADECEAVELGVLGLLEVLDNAVELFSCDCPLLDTVALPFESFSSPVVIDFFPQVLESLNLARRNLGLINRDFESS